MEQTRQQIIEMLAIRLALINRGGHLLCKIGTTVGLTTGQYRTNVSTKASDSSKLNIMAK
jgi:hypothetical protein